MSASPTISDTSRAEHLRWLLSLTGVPTAAGKEGRVIEWIEQWTAARSDLALARDPVGNLVLTRAGAGAPTLLFTAHLDHPAFVVEQIVGDPADPGSLVLSFRGGVMDPYFKDARIVVHTRDGRRMPATIVEAEPPVINRRCIAEPDGHVHAPAIAVGDVATWDLPEPAIVNGLLRTPACDDLAALVAALCAFDVIRASADAQHVGVLLTRAEEVGFIGAIGACKHGTIPQGARLLALENSRAFPDSPIGGGPIVRVGDKAWTFSPALTGAVAKLAETLQNERKNADRPFLWQRRLMQGGTCEATCFGAFGYESTCLCLPLGNYHNMGALDQVQAGDASAARIEPEEISIADFEGLVDLLVACGTRLGEAEPLVARMERLYAERSSVLGD